MRWFLFVVDTCGKLVTYRFRVGVGNVFVIWCLGIGGVGLRVVGLVSVDCEL